ncbi:MAG: transglycosylase SLT domain-containing protein [Acidithiobacillales bacterium]
MKPRLAIAPLMLAGMALVFPGAAIAQEPPAKPRALSARNIEKEFKGDFDGMVERRVIRVLAPYSRTFYFNDKGRERGFAAELVRDFERYVNQKYAKQLGKRPITVAIFPTTRDKLLTGVAGGYGDIAVGNLTVTEERKKIVDFFAPQQMSMSEIVLTGPNSLAINTADDLAGKTVHVRKSSSYHESLVALNDRLRKGGKPQVNLVLVPEALEDEDMMEMLNAGVMQAIVVDDVVARMWAPVLPKIRLNAGAAVRTGATSGWAIRKESPKLREILGEFYVKFVKKQNLIAARIAKYNRQVKQLKDPTKSADYKRFEETVSFFKKYGAKYSFDPLMLAAQGYQESQLNQQARSHVGAVGIMQVLPATGAELKVGDIHVAEPNVHAGTKYMDQLMTKYFPDAKFDEQNRTLFAFASYNAGPGNIKRMRTEAEKRGLDPNVWFNNVEIVTAAKIGTETTTYVRNIFKYYVAYKLAADLREAQQKAREAVKPGS